MMLCLAYCEILRLANASNCFFGIFKILPHRYYSDFYPSPTVDCGACADQVLLFLQGLVLMSSLDILYPSCVVDRGSCAEYALLFLLDP